MSQNRINAVAAALAVIVMVGWNNFGGRSPTRPPLNSRLEAVHQTPKMEGWVRSALQDANDTDDIIKSGIQDVTNSTHSIVKGLLEQSAQDSEIWSRTIHGR